MKCLRKNSKKESPQKENANAINTDMRAYEHKHVDEEETMRQMEKESAYPLGGLWQRLFGRLLVSWCLIRSLTEQHAVASDEGV